MNLYGTFTLLPMDVVYRRVSNKVNSLDSPLESDSYIPFLCSHKGDITSGLKMPHALS